MTAQKSENPTGICFEREESEIQEVKSWLDWKKDPSLHVAPRCLFKQVSLIRRPDRARCDCIPRVLDFAQCSKNLRVLEVD